VEGGVTKALEDPDALVRVEAARAVLHYGNAAEAEQVFRRALQLELLDRILLSGDLVRHAPLLMNSLMAALIKGGDETQIERALELMAGWGRFLPVDGIAELVGHRSARIRSAALRAIPFCSPADTAGAAAGEGLRDEDDRVRRAAAWAAGKLRLAEYGGAVEELLRAETPETRIVAAFALAGMGTAEFARLREIATGGEPVRSGPALEATEKSLIGRSAEQVLL
jgi:HEAT repeat protein